MIPNQIKAMFMGISTRIDLPQSRIFSELQRTFCGQAKTFGKRSATKLNRPTDPFSTVRWDSSKDGSVSRMMKISRK